ncbi:MAG: hypothetical protein QXP27_08955, partial [Candidatus Methanomethyliaceae archaeon]
MFRLRMMDMRIVFLAGDMARQDPLIEDLVAMGIYDILFNPIPAGAIIERLEKPATLRDVYKVLGKTTKPSSRRLFELFRKERSLKEALLGDEEEEKKKQSKAIRLPSFIPTSLKKKSEETVEAPKNDEDNAEKMVTKAEESPERPSKEKRREENQKKVELPPGKAANSPQDSFKPGGLVIAVWSPVASGKTFVATNLARALAREHRVALVDLDEKRAIYTWLSLLGGEEALNQVFRMSLLDPV